VKPKLVGIMFEALSDGPGTSSEVAIETGIPLKIVSATMSELREAGLVKVVGQIRENKFGRKSNIWSQASMTNERLR
jgi:DNA-binding transcriptional regulator GbsR (MarR family)